MEKDDWVVVEVSPMSLQEFVATNRSLPGDVRAEEDPAEPGKREMSAGTASSRTLECGHHEIQYIPHVVRTLCSQLASVIMRFHSLLYHLIHKCNHCTKKHNNLQ